jgi:hypothetical protein
MTDLYLTLVIIVLVVQNSPFRKEEELFIDDAKKTWDHLWVGQFYFA